MKRTILLCFVLALITSSLLAQKNSKKVSTAYAITPAQKGHNNWTEVRLVDVTTGQVVQTIYESKQETQPLNARTGKPITKKDLVPKGPDALSRERKMLKEHEVVVLQEFAKTKADQAKMKENHEKMKENHEKMKEQLVKEKEALVAAKAAKAKSKPVDLDVVLETKVRTNVNVNPNVNVQVAPVIEPLREIRVHNNVNYTVVHHTSGSRLSGDHPFATYSAAAAYDSKHERLYYTPMGINQLRYIDLKSNKIYYYEDDPFGALNSPRDAPNQITRMVIGSDGNGYALTNNTEHLYRFGTNKKAAITDLGALIDDPKNGSYSVKSSQGYGGDIIASADGDLYLFTANRKVFKIDIESKVATYKGTIKNLPREFSTNGAAVEEGMKVVVCSANSTLGYFSVDMNTLEATKLSESASVFNASDLASSNLLGEKKKKKKEQPKEEEEIVVKDDVVVTETARTAPQEVALQSKISVYPNPVSNGMVKISFEDHPEGRYQVQLIDISGKLVSSKSVNIYNKLQVEEYQLPSLIAKGSYVIQVINDGNKIVSTNKLAVQ